MGNFRVRICSAVTVLVIQASVWAMPTLGRAECGLAAPETVRSVAVAHVGRKDVVTQEAAIFPMLPTPAAMTTMVFVCISLVYSRRRWLAAIAGPLALLVVTFQHLPHVCRHSVTESGHSVSRHDGSLFIALSMSLSEMEQAHRAFACVPVAAEMADISGVRNCGQCMAVVCNPVDEPITVTVPGTCERAPPQAG
jgi:hypothetical protein